MNRAVWRKAAKIKVMKNDKNMKLTDIQFGREIVRLSANLPLVPPESINIVWANFKEKIQDSVKYNKLLREFTAYFEKQWMKMSPEVLSCATERHRTNNGLEGWNRRFNSKIRPKPTFISFLNSLRKEAKWQDFRLRRALLKREPRRKNQLIFESKFENELQKLQENIISAFDFLKKVTHLKRIIFDDY